MARRIRFVTIVLVGLFGVAGAALGSPLATLAEICDLAYAVQREDFKVPNEFQLVHSIKDKGSGFQGVSFLHEKGHVLVVAFSGTQFKDPSDLLADMGIARGVIESRAAKIVGWFRKALGKEEPPERKRIHRTKKLEAQIGAATKFLRDSRARVGPGKGEQTIIVGHSLGGYLAQVVGAQEKIGAHAFNGPGAAGAEIPPAGKLEQPILNHIRKHDLAGTFGEHIGQVVEYEDVPFELMNLKEPFLVRNHSMTVFKKDLAGGLKPVGETKSGSTVKDKMEAVGAASKKAADNVGSAVKQKASDAANASKKALEKLKFW